MKSCPHCKSTYPTHFSVCPQDAARLEDTNELAPGTLLRGKYKILAKIGEGGMGAVYKAQHVRFEEVCALKLVLPEHLADSTFLQRFHAEALLMRKLDHPHAVRVIDVDEAEDGLPFIVMEFVEGEPLDALLLRGALDPDRAVRIAIQACEALGAAHDLGIIHRDVKPANLLVARSADGGDFVKVMDFGIAKVKAGSPLREGASVTQTGALVGTPAYMSPEQCQGARGVELTGASDLYSLGIVLFQMLSGSMPFHADSTVGLILAHLQQTPPDLHALHPEISPRLVAVVRRALEKEPENRFATAQDMRRALEEAGKALDKTTIGSRPIPPSGDFELPATTRRETPRPGAIPAPAPPLTPRPESRAPSVSHAVQPVAPPATAPARTPASPAPPVAPPPPAPPPVVTPQRQAASASPASRAPAMAAPGKGPGTVAGIAVGVALAALIALGIWLVRRGGVVGHPSPDGGSSAGNSTPSPPPGGGANQPPSKRTPGLSGDAGSRSDESSRANPGTGASVTAPEFALLATLTGSKASVLSLAFTPGGRILASGNMDHSIGLWDPAAARSLGQLSGHGGPVYSVAFSPDGKILASASGDGTARLWELSAGRTIHTLSGHRDRIFSIAYSPDGRTVATASKDGTVRIWDTGSGSAIRTLSGHTAGVTVVAFSADGRYLASGGEDNSVRLWEADTGRLARTLSGHAALVHGLAFSPDARQLASASRDLTVRLWDVESGRELRVLRGHRGYVEAVAFDPQGNILASCSEDQSVKFWDVASGGELRSISGHAGWVITLAFRPDGKVLATGGADNSILLWRKQ